MRRHSRNDVLDNCIDSFPYRTTELTLQLSTLSYLKAWINEANNNGVD